MTGSVRVPISGNDLKQTLRGRLNPAESGKRFGAQLAALDGDAGARDIIAAHKGELVLVECDGPGVLHDIDRREDLTK